jgi:hypothetical protein
MLESGYECTHLAALPGLAGYSNRAQRTLLGKRLIAITNRDAVPGLHTTAQGAQRIFTLREFRNGDCCCAACALLRRFRRAVQGG